MERVELNGAQFAYEVRGSGEPVLLIHGTVFADDFAPVAAQPRAQPYKLIRYHRRGFGQSSHIPGPADSIAQHAADALALLNELGISRAHVVGHSFGAAVALQLALYARRVAQSLTLLEPLLPGVPEASEAATVVRPLVERFRRGEANAALDALLRFLQGDQYRTEIESNLGDRALEQALADAPTIFNSEVPAIESWQFERDQARHMTAPVMFMIGDQTRDFYRSSHDTLLKWFAAPEQMVVYRGGHLLHITNARAVANGMARFLARHPLPAVANAAQAR